MIRAALIALALAVVLPPHPTHAQASQDAEIAAIRTVLDRQTADWNRGDIEAFATGYKNSPDILFAGASVRRGYQGMLESYRKGYPGKAAMGVLSFSNEEIHLLDDRFADVIGNFHLERTAEGGGNADGNYALILEKTSEGWKIVVDHSASSPPKPVKPAVSPVCDTPDGHRFDFWLGDWKVSRIDGGHDGDSSVQSILGGCVILENWTDVNPYAGKSFNTFDQATKSWTQYWVDSHGGHTEFTNGVWHDPSLVFEGHNPGPKGVPAIQRFSFTRLDANNVRQLQEQSLDNGKTWTVAYDLHYTRKGAAN